MPLRPTNKIEPSGTNSRLVFSSANCVTFSSLSVMSPSCMSLGETQGMSPFQNSGFDIDGVLPPRIAAISFREVQHHPAGKSNDIFSSAISASAFCFLIFPSATNLAFSSAMRISNSLAGSSLGSCGTSLPRTASSRINLRSFLMPLGAPASSGRLSVSNAVIPGAPELRPARP
ncbi:hypothetical protein D3C84_504500 [compost metagenome]